MPSRGDASSGEDPAVMDLLRRVEVEFRASYDQF
jgi:hypothetical protein